MIFSIAIVMLGLSAAVAGTWVEANGPRKAMFVSACFWAAGFLVGSLGIATKQLWLLYLGYGLLGGIGLGIGYISPVSTLIKWFPDRPGLATGLAIMGFGGGAMVASPLSRQLLSFYDPGYDPANAGSTASGSALVWLFVTLGLGYFVIMMFGVANVRVPAPGLAAGRLRPGQRGGEAAGHHGERVGGERGEDPLVLAAVGGAVLQRDRRHRHPGAGQPDDPGLLPGQRHVGGDGRGGRRVRGLLSLFNMAGRFVWSSTSDVIGRKPIYLVYLGVGMVLYALLALVGQTSTALFVLLACVILSFYGGGFATVPAYLRDLFGTFQVGAIHGRLLTAWSAAGIAGPLIVNGFLDAQGEPGSLTAAAYRPALFTMVAVLAVGFVANLLVRPVPQRYHEPAAEQNAHQDQDVDEDTTAQRSGTR